MHLSKSSEFLFLTPHCNQPLSSPEETDPKLFLSTSFLGPLKKQIAAEFHHRIPCHTHIPVGSQNRCCRKSRTGLLRAQKSKDGANVRLTSRSAHDLHVSRDRHGQRETHPHNCQTAFLEIGSTFSDKTRRG